MKKKKSIRTYILLGILSFVLAVLCVLNCAVPFTDYVYKGFISSLNLGLDFKAGITATYDVDMCDEFNLSQDEASNLAIDRMQQLIAKNYAEGEVYRLDNNQIRIVIPSESISDNIKIGAFELKTGAEETTEDEEVITGKNITSVDYQYYNGSHGVLVKFDDEGKRLLSSFTTSATESSSSSFYIFLDKDYENSESKKLSTSAPITEGQLFLSKNDCKTKYDAENYAERIRSTMIGVNLKQVGSIVTEVAPALGNFAQVKTLIACLLIIVAVIVILLVRYRDFGILASVSIIINLIITLFITAISEVLVSISGIVGLMFGFAFTTIMHMIILEKIRAEYKAGKKINPSVKNGIKKTILIIVDICVVTLVPLITGMFAGMNGVKSLSFVFGFSVMATLFTSLLFFRLLLLNYLPLNTSKPKRLNFTREANTNEI